MKIISHVNEQLSELTIQNGEVYEIISQTLSEEENDDEGSTVHESLH